MLSSLGMSVALIPELIEVPSRTTAGSISIVDDSCDDLTDPDVGPSPIGGFLGSYPTAMHESTTTKRCATCGTDLARLQSEFDRGIKHTLNRYYQWLLKKGVPREEALHLVLALEKADIEL